MLNQLFKRRETPKVIIIGAGAAGIGMGIKLLQAGITSFRILEKSDGVGGTWRHNSYPGAACDIPSHMYSFSFDLNPDWPHRMSAQSDILAYLQRCSDKYGVTSYIDFKTEVVGARFDVASRTWLVATRGGQTHKADFLITCVGKFDVPVLPDVKGLDNFKGPIIHSGRWDHSADFAGKKVIVVGNGCSAAQIIPVLAEKAEKLTVFQRTASWVMPRRNIAYSARTKKLFHWFPWMQRLYRWFLYWKQERIYFMIHYQFALKLLEDICRNHLRAQIPDAELREKLTPHYRIGCKRVISSDDFYPSLMRPNVALETDGIDTVTETGILTKSGKAVEASAIVLATGFETSNFLLPMKITGLGGTTLDEVWKDGPEAYYGMSMPNFPNMFMMYGPNTSLGHNSVFFMIECEINYVMKCIRAHMAGKFAYLDLKPEAMRRFNTKLQKELEGSMWSNCTSWYRFGQSGKIVGTWSRTATAYWWETLRVRMSDYNLCEKRARPTAQPDTSALAPPLARP